VADAAIEMMGREDWSGMFVTLGAIDKAGHMWGADQDTGGGTGPLDCLTGAAQVHVACAAKNADDQLGKLLAAVKAKDASDGSATLIVLTADHGATHGASFYGKQTLLAGDTNWYYDPLSASFDGGAPSGSFYNNPSTEIAKLGAALGGNLQFSYQSTSIQAWLTNHDDAHKLAAIGPMSEAAGVIASYWRDGDRYILASTNPMTKSEKKWWKQNGQGIVDGMAADNGPDVVGLLHDDTGYGVYGDHGGATEEVQRVPMVFWSPGDTHGDIADEPFQTPDVMPTILRKLGIPLTHSVDGKSHKLE
jgi:Type I phosphodiesterase / nucleotide pyrophosphatase